MMKDPNFAGKRELLEVFVSALGRQEQSKAISSSGILKGAAPQKAPEKAKVNPGP